MQKPFLGLVVASLAVCPLLAAKAEGISYNYVDLGYVTTDIDGVDDELDGFVLRGSLELTDNWFLYARYLDESVSTQGVDVDYQEISVGGGYAWSFAENMDLYGKLGYTQAEIDVSSAGFGGFDVDDDGYELGVGIRARPGEPFELEGAINYVDLSDSGDDTSFGVAARWFIVENLALAVEGEFADDADTFGIGVRWAFGN
jgi:Outer membrane protein beta-barrel domain